MGFFNSKKKQKEKQFLFTYITGMNIKLNTIFRLLIKLMGKSDVDYTDFIKEFEDLTKIDKVE